MRGVLEWFEERGEIPLRTPWRVREYGPLTDDPDRPVDEHFDDSIRGVAFAIEYCDSHGFMSTRTIRCLAVDPRHPAYISAFCNVRDRVMSFRVDRIITIIDLRTARIISSEEHLALLGPYLAEGEGGPYAGPLAETQQAARDGVFALLQLAMRDGELTDRARDVILDYVRTEVAAVGCDRPPSRFIELWVDNLAPSLDCVLRSVSNLLEDKGKIARLMPRLLKVARLDDASADMEEELRELITAVRHHFRENPSDYPRDRRAVQ